MMKIVRHILAALILLAGARELSAQANPVSDAVRAAAADYGNNLLASARLMPAEKFGYKPTPAQMTFELLIAHVTGDNRATCSAIGGTAPASVGSLSVIAGKDALVGELERSLQFCDGALAHVTDDMLGDSVPYYGHRAPRAVAMVGLVTDWANHYSQQAIYLRLNGILPPTAKK